MLCCLYAEPTKLLGETGGFWIQTLVLLSAALIAAVAIVFASRSERRRATVELTLHQENNGTLVQAQEYVRNSRKRDVDFVLLIDKPTSQEYLDIVKVLNNYEFIAAAIHEGALSERMYKRIWRSRFIADWESLCAFVVDKRRKDGQQSFCVEYEALVAKWKKRPS